MKIIRLISFTIIIALTTTSCYWTGSRTVVGTGDVESMEIQVSSFTGVSITGACDVDIRIGETQEVWLNAQAQILDVITYEVKNEILHIGFEPDVSVNSGRDISADIVIPAVSYVAVTGAGDFKLSGSKQPGLDINITGTGNVDAFEMEVDDCTIMISGVGNCEVWVNRILDVQISGVGGVFYLGNPQLTTDVSGVGSVVNSNN